jgi:hypothetical protein
MATGSSCFEGSVPEPSTWDRVSPSKCEALSFYLKHLNQEASSGRGRAGDAIYRMYFCHAPGS